MRDTTTKAAAKKCRPPPPEDLADEALLKWDAVIERLDRAGRLDQVDPDVVALYCQTWARLKAARQHVDQFGPVVKFHNGYPGESPQSKLERQYAAELRRSQRDMGFTVATPPTNAAPDELEI